MVDSITPGGAARLAGIRIYPVKSLDGVSLDRATISPGGALLHDREFAIFDDQGTVVNGKRTARIHLIRADFEPERPLRLRLSAPDRDELRLNLSVAEDVDRAAQWLGEFFGYQVHLRRAPDTGFPDDLQRPGPTILSRATLEAVSTWLPHLRRAELGARFRANLEVDGVPAFWEDGLIAEEGVEFYAGPVRMRGLHPCARCVIPTRDPQTGEVDPKLAKTLAERRRSSLPAWADESKFSHYYRLSTNTLIEAAYAGQAVRIGDPIRLADAAPFISG